MKKMQRIRYVLVLVFIMWCTEGSAENFRNIFSLTYLDYSRAGTSKVYENAFIARVGSATSVLAKAYHDNRSGWNNTIITLGPIFNLDKYHYVEFTYGYGRDSNKRRADYLVVELTREKPGYIMGIGFKHSAYPGYLYNTLSPSIKYYLNPKFALWGKYFATIDSESNFDHAYWTYAEYDVTSRGAIRLGITGGNRLYGPEYESFFGGRADMSFSSVMAQCSFILSSRITLKYQYENISRQSKYTDIKNTLVLDTRF